MSEHDLVTETEAILLSGVSPKTLQRFIEAGYLTVSSNADSLKLFSKQELNSIFGTSKVEEGEGSSEAEETPSEDLSVAERPSVSTVLPPIEKAVEKPQQAHGSVLMLERLLDTRDAEIKDLKEQRDWLKVRLEKLEDKGQRDQVLLLSEAQTIKRLISLQENKRSAMQNVLAWFGVQQQQPVIDHKYDSNQ